MPVKQITLTDRIDEERYIGVHVAYGNECFVTDSSLREEKPLSSYQYDAPMPCGRSTFGFPMGAPDLYKSFEEFDAEKFYTEFTADFKNPERNVSGKRAKKIMICVPGCITRENQDQMQWYERIKEEIKNLTSHLAQEVFVKSTPEMYLDLVFNRCEGPDSRGNKVLTAVAYADLTTSWVLIDTKYGNKYISEDDAGVELASGSTIAKTAIADFHNFLITKGNNPNFEEHAGKLRDHFDEPINFQNLPTWVDENYNRERIALYINKLKEIHEKFPDDVIACQAFQYARANIGRVFKELLEEEKVPRVLKIFCCGKIFQDFPGFINLDITTRNDHHITIYRNMSEPINLPRSAAVALSAMMDDRDVLKFDKDSELQLLPRQGISINCVTVIQN